MSTEKESPDADLLDHEYDGIKEYDNPMPRWWVGAFWASFVFSIGYIGYYLAGHGQSVEESFREDERIAREERAKSSLEEAPSEAVLSKLMADAGMMQDAKLLFGERCAVCHGAEGQGLIGPNLTDNSWIHGKGQLMDIFGVVSHGVTTKGMPAWELTLQPIEVRKLVAFVGTLRGKSLPGKAPEGQPVAAVP
ncbi:MAG: c-type cytochrome [Myxococcota bacterium]|nr:c-type cytochrome [Myxococcota bacterium]